jgi:hypothetical protein
MCCLHANIKKKWQAQARPLGLSFIFFCLMHSQSLKLKKKKISLFECLFLLFNLKKVRFFCYYSPISLSYPVFFFKKILFDIKRGQYA